MRSRFLWAGAVLAAVLAWTAVANMLQAAGPKGSRAQADEQVEMFAAMKSGQIQVKLIPKDSKVSRVMITNTTDKPLTVKLPDAFAGVPVLAQAAGGAAPGGGGGGGGSRSSNNADQALGGGMGGMGGMGGGGMGGGMFNVAPEKVGQFTVPTVCLEHGKHEPTPKTPYEIRPLESFAPKAEVRELCRMLGRGELNQRAAQVAAWHLNNGMSFEQLAAKQLRYADGRTSPYFSPAEIQGGMQIVSKAAYVVRELQTRSKQSSMSQQ